MNSINTLLTFLMIVIAAYFNYMIFNILFTVFKIKKNDKTLQHCLNTGGVAFYIILTILYIFIFFGSIVLAIIAATRGQDSVYLNAMVANSLFAILYSFQIANIVFVGKKQMLVGRLLIDYRKMKKVDLNYRKEMSFVYSQKTFKFPTRFVDVAKLRRSISRRS